MHVLAGLLLLAIDKIWVLFSFLWLVRVVNVFVLELNSALFDDVVLVA